MYQALTKQSHNYLKTVFSRRGVKKMLTDRVLQEGQKKVSRTALENTLKKGTLTEDLKNELEKFTGRKLEVDEYSIKATV